MKIRNGYVSNSSSSSFIAFKHKLTLAQLEFLRDWYQEYTKQQTTPETEWLWTHNYYSFINTLNEKECNSVVGRVNQLGESDLLAAITAEKDDFKRLDLENTFVESEGVSNREVIRFSQIE